MRRKQNLKLDLRGEDREGWEGNENNIGEIAKDRGTELKTIKKVVHDRDQYRKRIVKGNREGKEKEEG